jgi:arylsulfatase A-like enzyme
LATLDACRGTQEPAPDRLPNFVVILTDDMGWGDLGSNGATQWKTPRLDLMAREGVRFTDFYVPSPVCTQSRFGLLTGRYSIRANLDHVLFPTEHVGIPSWEITIGGALKRLGYQTGCIGKWHLGSDVPYLPLRHGFDYFFGLPHSNDMSPLPLIRGEQVIDANPNQDALTAQYTAEALQFIVRSKDRPFFLYLAHTSPHVPLHVSAGFRNSSDGGLYGDVIQELDWSTGQVLDALRNLGIDDNTLVLFTSDNGPWLEQGAGGGSAGPFRGGKMTVYEGGIRVPCIAYWPGRIAAGRVLSAPSSSLDFLPTFVHLAGGKIRRDRVMDGVNAWPVWSGEQAPSERTLYFYVVGELPLGVRAGKWKMHMAGTSRRLYDLSTDPSESTDLAADNSPIVADLSSRVELWQERVEIQKAAEADL